MEQTYEIRNIKVTDLEINKGQIFGLPKDAKAVPGFEGYYATPDGRLFTTYKRVAEIATKSLDKDGYMKATLFKDGKYPHYFRKHRVIAMTFMGKSDLMVNHKNGIKTDNRIENLEYVTQRENQSHWRKTKGFGVGVCFDKKSNKWRAYYQKDHKWEHLGFFDSKEDAKSAYLNKLKTNNITNKYSI